MAKSPSSITRKRQIGSPPIEPESDVKRQCFTVEPTNTMTTATTNASIHLATSSRPATPHHTSSQPLSDSDSEPVESLASCGSSWLGPNSDGEDTPRTRRVFNDFFDLEPTGPLMLRTVFDFNGPDCQMVLATLEDMETRLRGSDPPVVPWTRTAPLRQFPSQPSYFWLMHWKAYIDEEMEKAWAMWQDTSKL
jgi:hypothetical protein